MQIDINCDLGESYGHFRIGQDEALFPYLTSCNIACGFHGGDPVHMRRTVELALQYEVRIGAHPGYNDLAGFGRRPQSLDAEELTALLVYQIGALHAMCSSMGAKLAYIKPHGALYNHLAHNETDARTAIHAIQSIDKNLALMGLAGSPLANWAQEEGISFLAEAFIDRTYEADGRLRSRKLPGALITDSTQAVQQLRRMFAQQEVIAYSGECIPLIADSYCIHGDNPEAVTILKAVQIKFSSRL